MWNINTAFSISASLQKIFNISRNSCKLDEKRRNTAPVHENLYLMFFK